MVLPDLIKSVKKLNTSKAVHTASTPNPIGPSKPKAPLPAAFNAPFFHPPFKPINVNAPVPTVNALFMVFSPSMASIALALFSTEVVLALFL